MSCLKPIVLSLSKGGCASYLRMYCLWLALAAISVSGGLWQSVSESSVYGASSETSPAKPDESQVCGRNALFVLLGIYGIDCSLTEVSRVTPIGIAGTTLAELKQAAAHFLLPCDMIKTDIEALERSNRYPCIVLNDGGGLIPDADGNPVSGHYWVLLRFSPTDNTVHVIDGTYGVPGIFTRERFRERWTGFALIPRSERGHIIDWTVTCLHASFWVIAMRYCKKTTK
ncbi:MAG: cysteine peptidase family C39 domain-containing protein [Planctomycetota bacterium]